MQLLDDFIEVSPKKNKKYDPERLHPTAYLSTQELVDFIPLLEQAAIDYDVEKINPALTASAILPMDSSQLHHMNSVIYVRQKDLVVVTELLKNFAPTLEAETTAPLEESLYQPKMNWLILVAALLLLLSFLVTPLFL